MSYFRATASSVDGGHNSRSLIEIKIKWANMHNELKRAFLEGNSLHSPWDCSSQDSQITPCIIAGGHNTPQRPHRFLELLSGFSGRCQARVLRKGYLFTYHIKLLNWPVAGVF